MAISTIKKTVQSASQSAAGLMSATDKTKLDGIAAGAQVNSITGVKGDLESSYRTGNINITPANIGAVPTSSIINNLTSGGTSVPLSAEMGKTLKGTLTQLESTVKVNKYPIRSYNKLKSCRFVVIGDSYAGGYTPETGSILSNGWAKQLQTTLNIADSDFIISHDGGTGFANAGSSVTWGNTVNTISVSDPDSVDYVIFCGGYNDASKTTQQIIDGMTLAIGNARTRFVNADICVGFVGMSFADYSAYNALRYAYKVYKSHESDIGYHYLKGIEYALHISTQFSESDKMHPNVDGNRSIMDALLRCLMTGKNDAIYEGNVKLSFPTGVTMDDSSCIYSLKDGRMTVCITKSTIRFTNPPSTTWNQADLPLFSGNVVAFFNSGYDDNKAWSAICKYDEGSGNKYKVYNGFLTRKDFNTLSWKISDTNDSHTNYRTSAIYDIQAPHMKFTANLWGEEFY